MLLEFSCANFRSINHKCTLSLLGQGISDMPKTNFVLLNKKLKVLKTAALYGANSSGKSNIIRAFSSMISHIIDSVKLNDSDELNFDPFRLSSVQGNATFLKLFLRPIIRHFAMDSSLIKNQFVENGFIVLILEE